MTAPNAAASACADGCVWVSHLRGGEPLYVKICMLCKRIDWDDLAEQVARVRAQAAEDLRPLIKALTAVYDTYLATGGYEPTPEQINAGMASLTSIEDSRAMEAACDGVVPHLVQLRRFLAGDAPTPAESVVTAPDRVGRCGDLMPSLVDVRPRHVCALPAGHAGWHRSDDGGEWTFPAVPKVNIPASWTGRCASDQCTGHPAVPQEDTDAR